MARDNAFCFYYEDGLAELRRQGAELVEFSPMEDTALPAGACGLYLGGGYPELYARRLSENIAMRKAVRKAVLGGMPCVAECGGFLYLHQSMEGSDGESYPMANVLEARAYRTDRMGRFGYVTLTAEKDNLLCRAGETLPGHEFHYWESTDPGRDLQRESPTDRKWTVSTLRPVSTPDSRISILHPDPRPPGDLLRPVSDIGREIAMRLEDILTQIAPAEQRAMAEAKRRWMPSLTPLNSSRC
ncbi:MAG: hypothetical protein ACLSAF_16440 [Intestinimonas sp.]